MFDSGRAEIWAIRDLECRKARVVEEPDRLEAGGFANDALVGWREKVARTRRNVGRLAIVSCVIGVARRPRGMRPSSVS
jgi:hypothetical protein